MSKIDHMVSADMRCRVEFVRLHDGSYGYVSYKNAGSAQKHVWENNSRESSRFGSYEIAVFEASASLAWLKKETEWPARALEPVAITEYSPGWIKCPFCGKRFDLQDPDRWGGSRHLTCGQKVINQVKLD